MGDMLSQAEIDALLSGALSADDEPKTSGPVETVSLTPREIDALGEIGNISMGTSATTLYTLLGQKVMITTPKVTVTTWEELSRQYPQPYVAVKVKYTNGLTGDNLLVMQEQDVKIITDLMMGGTGQVDPGTELTELHLSAISEAMNQMVGSAATSLSSMFDKRVDISPPESLLVDLSRDSDIIRFEDGRHIVKIEFSLTVGDIIDSKIMQLLPISFAKELVANLYRTGNSAQEEPKPVATAKPSVSARPAPTPEPQRNYQPQAAPQPQPQPQPFYSQPDPYAYGYPQMPQTPQPHQNPINVQPAQFQSFEMAAPAVEVQNIGLLMDVPLQITVELGRTSKKIKEILEFGQGSIIELDKLAGEPVDILVNGKNIAKGEVVVIDESFGVRITDIIHPSKRL
jgi:flagellar motor switch protein FliN/FliY